jgi:hypothetical protein
VQGVGRAVAEEGRARAIEAGLAIRPRAQLDAADVTGEKTLGQRDQLARVTGGLVLLLGRTHLHARKNINVNTRRRRHV